MHFGKTTKTKDLQSRLTYTKASVSRLISLTFFMFNFINASDRHTDSDSDSDSDSESSSLCLVNRTAPRNSAMHDSSSSNLRPLQFSEDKGSFRDVKSPSINSSARPLQSKLSSHRTAGSSSKYDSHHLKLKEEEKLAKEKLERIIKVQEEAARPKTYIEFYEREHNNTTKKLQDITNKEREIKNLVINALTTCENENRILFNHAKESYGTKKTMYGSIDPNSIEKWIKDIFVEFEKINKIQFLDIGFNPEEKTTRESETKTVIILSDFPKNVIAPTSIPFEMCFASGYENTPSNVWFIKINFSDFENMDTQKILLKEAMVKTICLIGFMANWRLKIAGRILDGTLRNFHLSEGPIQNKASLFNEKRIHGLNLEFFKLYTEIFEIIQIFKKIKEKYTDLIDMCKIITDLNDETIEILNVFNGIHGIEKYAEELDFYWDFVIQERNQTAKNSEILKRGSKELNLNYS